MIKRIIFPILILFCLQIHAQKADSIFAAYMHNKQLPQGYIPEFCMALSYFPELADTHIEVKAKNIRTTMAARLSFASYFKKKSKRTYVLFIDTLFNGRKGLFFDLYTTARVGIIGHELSHVSAYNQKNFFGLMGYDVIYLFNKKKIEHKTDETTIEHGMYSQLSDYARIAFDPQKVGKKYYRYKTRHYYSPEQLSEISSRK
jgi:hypothetical protein